ncbi:CGH_1_HP_G0099210.mRNA.1.CDS.1 [Saccharomyces cerevisiae]|nr:CGH_1_HP_G0099210.mRNA.1.CDS.1 [Saccharomyces cerevisiae]CAI6945998.1 CGH_1_HP_G0099210.mRNA.1.CDS.1 [Saccharomyces cerevisiae]
MSHPIQFVNANNSDKSHQLGGQYSIPQDLRENLQKEAARIGENEKDVLQEKWKLGQCKIERIHTTKEGLI